VPNMAAAIHAAEPRLVGKHDPQAAAAPGGRALGALHVESRFFYNPLSREIALRMIRTRHQLAPARPCDPRRSSEYGFERGSRSIHSFRETL
jgi:hypothetical protein